MKITIFGTRGSLPAPGPETVRYGGNTACVMVETEKALLALDAGSGLRRMGDFLAGDRRRVDILLSHLHVDHIQGLGFFAPLFEPGREVHIWGPVSTTQDLRGRLARYLSPPLFPVPIRELASVVSFHDLPPGAFAIGDLMVQSQLICHPGPTVGYRIWEDERSFGYLSDHEPALGARDFPGASDWLSGFGLAEGATVLFHDAQYFSSEYDDRIGWGHSTIDQTLAYCEAAAPGRLVTFHHDPSHSDEQLEQAMELALRVRPVSFPVEIGAEGAVYEI